MSKSVLIPLFAVFAFAACTPKPESGGSVQMTAQDLNKRGKEIYVSSCIACHNADPAKDGALGPAIKGSSLELIEARVLRASYPTGYTPKRATAQMVALPHLEKEIAAIHAFLNAN